MDRVYKIGRFDEFSDGSFRLSEEFTTESPYWEVKNGVVYYVFWDVIKGRYIERKKQKMNMSKEEALQNNCACYYSIL